MSSDKKLDAMLSNIPGILYRGIYKGKQNDLYDMKNQFVVEYISDQIEELTGYPASRFMDSGQNDFDMIIHPDDREKLRTGIMNQIRQKKAFLIEYRMVDIHGNIKWVFEKGQGFFGNDGELLWLDGAIFDITERKLMEKDLFQTQARCQNLVESVEEWIWETNALGIYTFSNAFTQKMLGYSAEELLGRSIHDFLPESDAAKWPQFKKNDLEIPSAVISRELPFTHKNGKKLIIEVSSRPFFSEEGFLLGFRGVGRNITLRKQMEQEALNQQKLQGVLEIAGAICHEMNQPLAAIQLFINFAIEECDPDAIIYKDLIKIRDNALRMGEISLKLMNITNTRTKEYIGGQKIIDIEQATEDSPES
ncbi:PAS domain-containing sensor histidine kinase [Desulfocicer vacuolatum]|nr:PAS domain S-box protein [Desulfocicer vacuolatum]